MSSNVFSSSSSSSSSYLVVCLAQAVRCTSLINWLRLGTFSLVLRVIKLGVADNFLALVMLPHSSVIFNVKSGNVTRLSFFRMVPLLDAIDVDDVDDGIAFNRVSDADADIGNAIFNLPSE